MPDDPVPDDAPGLRAANDALSPCQTGFERHLRRPEPTGTLTGGKQESHVTPAQRAPTYSPGGWAAYETCVSLTPRVGSILALTTEKMSWLFR